MYSAESCISTIPLSLCNAFGHIVAWHQLRSWPSVLLFSRWGSQFDFDFVYRFRWLFFVPTDLPASVIIPFKYVEIIFPLIIAWLNPLSFESVKVPTRKLAHGCNFSGNGMFSGLETDVMTLKSDLVLFFQNLYNVNMKCKKINTNRCIYDLST